MRKATRVVGPKGQVVIPKEIRDQVGLLEGTDVLVEVRNDEVVVRRAGPPTKSYVEYFTSTHAPKVKGRVNVKALIEEETIERSRLR